MAKSRSVSPMSRVMLRSEFEKRLADYSTQMLKAFKTYESHWDAQLAELRDHLTALDTRLADIERTAVPDALLAQGPPADVLEAIRKMGAHMETTAP